TTEIGALQIDVAVTGSAAQQQSAMAKSVQLLTQGCVVERQVHGVSRLGVGELEIELGATGQAGAGAAQGDARWRQLAQLLPGVFGGGGLFGHAYLCMKNLEDSGQLRDRESVV